MPAHGFKGTLRAKGLIIIIALAGWFCLNHAAQPYTAEAVASAPGGDSPALQLTAEEREWLHAHRVLRWGQDPNWPPFSGITKSGKIEGIDNDLLAQLGELLGVRFEPMITRNWAETLNEVQKGQVDVVSGIAPTPAREQWLDFTRPYVNYPVAVITRTEAPFSVSMAEVTRQKLALPRAYVATEQLLADYPTAQVKNVNSTLEALTEVSNGSADATIENLVVASYVIRKNGLTNLKIAGMTGYYFELCLGVPHDRPLLFSAINKALATINDAKMYKIVDRWISIENDNGINWRKVASISGAIVGGLILCLGYFFIRQRRLARELAYRRSVEEKLLALNEQKNELINIVAHDLNNPLAIIMLKCRLWSMDDNTSAKLATSYFREIEESARHMTEFISNFLNLNAIEEGVHQIALQPVRISPILEKAVARDSDVATQKGITLQIENELPADLEVIGNSDALSRVLNNLISNGIKFTPPGKKVTIQLQVRGENVELIVHDEGPGIPIEEQEKLFKKFTRLSTQPTGGEASHGLGLAIVKELVRAMQGEVWCDSKPGHGATFGIRLKRVS